MTSGTVSFVHFFFVFAFIAKRVPSVYYMVGTGDHAPGHSSKFLVDEKYIKLCTRTMVLGALELLEVKGF